MNHGFTEEDEKKYVEALNYIANEATFCRVDTVKGSIELYKHFNFLQSIMKKINAHILEVRAMHLPEPTETKKKGKK